MKFHQVYLLMVLKYQKIPKQHQTFSEQEIGKGTVNTPTKAKDVAMEKVCQDLQIVVDKKKEKIQMEDNYSKAYKEVIEILNYVPQESVNKIPQTMIDTFKAKMDVNYDFKVDINKSFEEQVLLDETKAILANIFRDYWATPYQRERIEAKEKYDRQKAR